VRDPRLVTVRRGGSLADEDHHLLALWAAECAEHVLSLFEADRPDDPRPRRAIEATRSAACRWQRRRLPEAVRDLVLEDRRRRNEICWHVFDA
jgi:hypothetical protein